MKLHAAATPPPPSELGTIPDQVRLPASVALEVVLQGLRIRLGRSIVTLTGIICGIAFLMSIVTGQLIKRGVATEDALRETVDRMDSFVHADLPILTGRSVAVLGGGPLSEIEIRLLERLVRTHGAAVYLSPTTALEPGRPIAGLRREAVEAPSVILIMGEASSVSNYDWLSFFSGSSSTMAATTIIDLEPATVVPEAYLNRFVQVSRAITADEKARMIAEARKDRFRTLWISAISLLVTVIGISNAMLMSVTERFREIGTMKCLGALSSFVTRMFVMEATILGFVGGVIGVLAGSTFSLVIYGVLYDLERVAASLPLGPLLGFGLAGLGMSVLLSIVAAIYPARVAAAMIPATALRSTI